MNNKFRVKLSFIVLTTDIPQNKQYILSLNKDSIQPPSLYVDENNVTKISEESIKYLQSLVLVDRFQLLPQIISLNETHLPNLEPDTINVVYGSITKFTPSLNQCYWVPFSYFSKNDYNDVILKTVQRLQ